MPYADLKPVAAGRPQPLFFCGGFVLTVLAGAVNVAMLSFYAVPVSHMSGAVSRLGMDLGARRYEDLPVIGMILGAFAIGCALTGALVGTSTLADRNRYTWVMACEVAALGAAAALLGGAVNASVVLCACACGIQNAMASSYYGLVVRTTHVTGIITDLGFMVGARLTGRRFASWKYLLLTILVSGYLVGGCVAAMIVPAFPGAMLWGCCALAAAIAVGCHVFHRGARAG
ncbi:MAG: DUF1275 domain-containing protein [Planctomycetes bacterium]|nr:DUF1275 domain-containing protein [Planctomycetota bacterium]